MKYLIFNAVLIFFNVIALVIIPVFDEAVRLVLYVGLALIDAVALIFLIRFIFRQARDSKHK